MFFIEKLKTVSKTRLYKIWIGMKSRCINTNTYYYKDYGGRGITICEEWLNDYKAFYDWAIENGYQDDLSIDRINNDGNYEPINCRWATAKEQANNRRTKTSSKLKYITIDGETHTYKEWGELLKINQTTFKNRYLKGFRGTDLMEPPKGKRSVYKCYKVKY